LRGHQAARIDHISGEPFSDVLRLESIDLAQALEAGHRAGIDASCIHEVEYGIEQRLETHSTQELGDIGLIDFAGAFATVSEIIEDVAAFVHSSV
jgi:hypothetical protein